MPRNSEANWSLKHYADVLQQHDQEYRAARGASKKGPVLDMIVATISRLMQEKGLVVPTESELLDVRDAIRRNISVSHLEVLSTESKKLVQ
jgi:hypothetical protein